MRLLPVFHRGERVLAAVSGGADSVALLLALKAEADAGAIVLCAGHVHHGIRQISADEDRAFVKALCASLGVPYYERFVDAPGYRASHKTGLETAARTLRRDALCSMMREAGATVIATAHHADDQAETLLMHLLRGGGLRGASGISPRQGDFARPLLGINKSELKDFLSALNQPYREDETNFVPDNPRNKLRLSVLPLLRGIYPGCVSALGRFAKIASEEDAFLNELAEAFLLENAEALPFGWRLRAGDFPKALVKRALFGRTGLEYADIASLYEMYLAPRGARAFPGARAERAGDWLYWIDAEKRAPQTPAPLTDGAYLPGLGVLRMRPAKAVPIKDDPFSQVVDEGALSGACIRTRRAGDRFHPLGGPGDRLLSDVLIDRKIDRPLRDYLPLVAVGSRILWIPGVMLSREAALSKETKSAVLLRFEREDISRGA